MVSSANSSFQNILLQVTNAKLDELKIRKNLISSHFTPILQQAFGESNDPALSKARILNILYDGVRDSPVSNIFPEILIENLKYFLINLEQDPSISQQIISVWIAKLKEEIEFAKRKCDYSYLYGSLLSEWLEIEDKRNQQQRHNSGGAGGAGNKDEKLDKKKAIEDLKARIFSTPDFDKANFLKFLTEEVFFAKDNVNHQRLIEQVKKETKEFFDYSNHHVRVYDVKSCITGLCSEDHIAEHKKVALKQLQENSDALDEVASLLTNRIRNLSRWDWPEDLMMDVNRGLAGKYRALMDEEILTTLFLQYIGVYWGSYFKRQFLRIYDSTMWSRPKGFCASKGSIEAFRERCHRSSFLSMLPDSMQSQESQNPNEYVQVERSMDSYMGPPPPTQALYGGGMIESAQNSLFGHSAKIMNCQRMAVQPQEPPIDLRQTFLHIISTEILLNQTVRPESPFVIVQADLDSFGESLLHESILSIMEFLGVPKIWLDFFQKYLQTPITLSLDEPTKVRTRGIPDAHVLSSLFGETVLFCLDLHINRTTGINLYRVFDDFWFWGHKTESIVQAWNILEKFGGMLGLKINEKKSGSISIYSPKKLGEMYEGRNPDDILRIPGPKPLPSTSIRWAYLELQSNGLFSIDEKALSSSVQELKVLLEKSECALEFVNIYNKYMEFFIRNFGKNALVFGNQHISQITNTLRFIHRQIFTNTNGNAVESLKSKFKILTENDDVVDIWVYWPLEKGGLGLVNPFLEIMSLHATYEESGRDSETGFTCLLIEDKNKWDTLVDMLERRNAELPENSKVKVDTFEEYCDKRESTLLYWYERYMKLLERPIGKEPTISDNIYEIQSCLNDEKTNRNHLKWLFAYYEPQLIQHFGTVKFINTELLPMSMISIIQKTKVQV